jgi:hypothetical protein
MATVKSIDPTINEHIQMMAGDPTAYDAWAKTQGTRVITPEMIPDSIRKIYEEQATEQLHPWFQNETNLGKTSTANAMGQNEADYQNTVDQLNQGLQSDTETLNNKEGMSGTWGSSARAERLASLANQYQNKYQGAYNSANANVQNNLMNAEYKYGTDMALNNQPKFSQYNVSPTAQVSQGQTARYNPFGGQGTLNVGAQNSAINLAGDYLGARIKNPNYAVR